MSTSESLLQVLQIIYVGTVHHFYDVTPKLKVQWSDVWGARWLRLPVSSPKPHCCVAERRVVLLKYCIVVFKSGVVVCCNGQKVKVKVKFP